jgi:hypothetical protein
LVDPEAGGAPRAQRDALKLLAVLVQHTDSKPEQQHLLCVDKNDKEKNDKNDASIDDGPCAQTFMMVHDLGQTFGHANAFNRNSVGSANLKEWSNVHIWANSTGCVANLAVEPGR